MFWVSWIFVNASSFLGSEIILFHRRWHFGRLFPYGKRHFHVASAFRSKSQRFKVRIVRFLYAIKRCQMRLELCNLEWFTEKYFFFSIWEWFRHKKWLQILLATFYWFSLNNTYLIPNDDHWPLFASLPERWLYQFDSNRTWWTNYLVRSSVQQ